MNLNFNLRFFREVTSMKMTRLIPLLGGITLLTITLAGCGVSKSKYEALLNENIDLEENLTLLVKTKDALKKEYDNLLDEKMKLAVQIETLIDEKKALKSEYDKLLDEKIALKTAYDKVLEENKKLQGKNY